jgi:protein-L-isoaspartate(D-aspartate) O-methyltransferase
MVESQIRRRGINDARVLDVMRTTPRHLFVPNSVRRFSYEDGALPIGYSQTISQPIVVATMTEALRLKPTDRVLEIGTGSGYQAAILSKLASQIYTIEIVKPLAEQARRTLSALGYRNVFVRSGNGYLGWPEKAPFDAIIVTAAPDEVPQTLINQLADNGRMVIPVGTGLQSLIRLTKQGTRIKKEELLPVMFVPMIGKPGKSKHPLN